MHSDEDLSGKQNQNIWIPGAGGFFLYQEASNLVPLALIKLESVEFIVSGQICIDFWYHMWGSEMLNELKVMVKKDLTEIDAWRKNGNQGNSWLYGSRTLQFPTNSSIKVTFEAVRGKTENGDTAIDNIAIRRGRCNKESSCILQGDPHYLTFDQQTHNFMGTCTYTLSKLCDANSSLPYFNVEAANERRSGNPHVSYVRHVNVDVYSHRIVLGKERVVKVDGEVTVLPVWVTPDVLVARTGQYVVLTTSFGLRVKFNGKHRAEVTLPNLFMAKVCGMCGNYNEDRKDDFLNPDGIMEPDSVSLGNSWQTQNDSRCAPDIGIRPNCSIDEKRDIESKDYCGIILDVHGPFKGCHYIMNPEVYFADCVYDLCALGMDQESLCSSLESYGDACQSEGAIVESWRNETFCPLECGANSHYEQWGTACPATCDDPHAPSNCLESNVEGCLCDSGYVLSNDSCVPEHLCGCWHDGKHYPVGNEFWTDDTCSTQCRCPSAGSELVCWSSTCPDDSHCGIADGVPGCYPHTYGVCRVHNDPHYNTFDKETLHFMGSCTYLLAKLCVNSSSLPYFNIEAKNEHRGNAKVSYVQKVLVAAHGHEVWIVKSERHRVLVDEVWTTLPVRLADGAVSVSRSGRYVVLSTDFGLDVSYDTDHSVEVKLPSTYFNQTCGMCGNYNGLRKDDRAKRDGEQARDDNELGNSWKVWADEPGCDPGEAEGCPPADEERYSGDAFCGLMTSQQGPFVDCHSVINPHGLFESCVVEMCLLEGHQEALCNSLQTYTDACKTVGVSVQPWRNSTFCPIKCEPNSHYNTCASACPATCSDRFASENCSKPCVEDCECNHGFVVSGSVCVPVTNCGCTHKGKYYQKGEMFWEEGCRERCHCAGNDRVECEPGFCGAGEVCKVQGGNLGCQKVDTAICHVYGDPHYTTYDGKLYHYQGACNYTVTETCGNTSVQFSVTSRNEHRGSQTWSILNSVALHLENLHIAVRKHKHVYVDGVKIDLPAMLCLHCEVARGPSWHDYRSDVAVDDISFHAGCCGEGCGTTAATTTTSSMTTTTAKSDTIVRATCSASGDPHYNTFDTRVHHFMGTCTYVLSKLCNRYSGLPYFEVSATNEHRGANTKVSYIKSVHVAVHNNTVSIMKNRKVLLNGERVNLPVSIKDLLVVRISGGYVLLETNFGLLVRFDGHHHVDVSVPSTYSGLLCGLCGNYNGDPNDDIIMPNGSLAADSNMLGESWQVDNGETECNHGGSGFQCDPADKENAEKDTACGMITDPTGIFKECHEKVPPKNYFDNCVYDVCAEGGLSTSLCLALQTYAALCTQAGVCVEWRNNTLCSPTCPSGSHYETCGTGCPTTCMETSAPDSCPLPSVEGCFCDPGYTLSGDICILNSQCGCVHHNKYYQSSESWFTNENCTEHCTCMGNNVTLCKTSACELHEICERWDGVLGCQMAGCFWDCNFDSNLCQWSQSKNDMLDWRRISGPTPSLTTGPDFDHTTAGGHYIYLEGNDGKPGDRAQLVSPPCANGGAYCMRFWYHMYGAARTMMLNVYQVEHGIAYLEWSMTGNKGNRWIEGELDFYLSPNSQILLEAVRGNDYRSDVAVDDISFHAGCCGEGCGTTAATTTTSSMTTTTAKSDTIVRATCSASGDPHYNTFDTRVHHFMGTCTYVLSKLCNRYSGLPYFEVSATNEHRGANTKVSYIKSVHVAVHNNTVSIMKNRKVLLNGERVNLPVSIKDLLVVRISGGYVLLETNFGLLVRFDGHHHVDVSVSSTYSGLLCGLCGNYNGDPNDDIIMPNGSLAADSNMLGESWQVDNGETECNHGGSGFQCDPADKENAEKDTACGMITDPTGIFKECHEKVPPKNYFDNCVYDVCAEGGLSTSLCLALQTYAALCTQAGVCVEWRNNTLCSPTCPSGSHYETCGTGCPTTCMETSAPDSCPLPSVEGCFCDPGYTLSGDICILNSQCGCVHHNKYYQSSESWFTNENCTERCTCMGNNVTLCKTSACELHEICERWDGVLGCQMAGCFWDCNFDSNLCQWSQSKNDMLDWRRISGPTPTPITGPDFDHTTAGGHYIYLEGNDGKPGDRAQLVSPPCANGGAYCMRFWYHMYGVARTMMLNVYQVEHGIAYLEWSMTGNKGNRWIEGELYFYLSPNSQILLEAVRGNDYRSDVAVDDISFHAGCCGEGCGTTAATTTTSSMTTTTAKSDTIVRATCSASGDPHYNTFDTRVHHFMGTCTYVLSKLCNRYSGLPYFEVSATNEHRGANTKVSYIKSVHVAVHNNTVSIMKNRKVLLNGERVNLPVSIKDLLVVRISGGYVLLETNFGLLVRFDGHHHVDVSVPSTYSGLLCGLCGNYNGDPNDDIIMPNGSLAADSNMLGESWQVDNGETECNHGGSSFQCDPADKENAEKDTACGMITDPTGIFKECHEKVPPKNYFDNCVYDVCAEGGLSTSLCLALQTYAALCTQAGVCVEWRNNTLCSPTCPSGSHYETCGTGCPTTCMETSAPDSCPLPSVEGCFCDPGYTLSGDICILNSQCGCVHHNKYYQSSESWFTNENCTEHCTCMGNNVTLCNTSACELHEICERWDGVLGCQMAGCFWDCNFDSNLCQWSQSKNDMLDWRRISGPTPSLTTGPDFDHTTAGGHYIYLEGNDGKPGDRAQLVSPPCANGGAYCMRFWYHMYGAARTMMLNVYQVEHGIPYLEWSMTGNKGNRWIEGELAFYLSPNSQILLEAVRGNDYRSDVAVDDISFHAGCCGEGCGTTAATTTTSSMTTTTAKSDTIVRATCSASGDPHYNTFDTRVHHFMGTCTYVLSKLCNRYSGLPYFEVSATNEHRGANTKVSYIKSVHVAVHNNTVSIMKNRKVLLNGERVNLPVSINDLLVVRISGGYVLLETNFGLLVRFDGHQHVDVSVSSTYSGLLCGLCGNYNSDPNDDIIMPNGSLAADSNMLGESWQVDNGETECNHGGSGFQCDPADKENAEKDTACGMITDPTGIFKECHEKVPPKNYFDNCVYDVCAEGGLSTTLCLALQTYAALCTQAGVCVEWRNNTLCSPTCPSGSHYETCGTGCPTTCMETSAPDSCPLPSVEGCFCDPGYTLSGDICIMNSQCGCVHHNKYYQSSESWFTNENCTERCTCMGNNVTLCNTSACELHEICERWDGVLGCQMAGSASCHIAGDTHYYTFDKVMYSFSSSCVYTLVNLCDTSNVPPLSINVLSEGQQLSSSYLKEIYIDVYGIRITLQKNRKTLLDGVRARSPIQSHMKGINIKTNGIYTMVETDFGMSVKFDGNRNLEISLPKAYYAKVCGLCGDYNGQQSDEFRMPNGIIAENADQFGNSWKSGEFGTQSCLPRTQRQLDFLCSPSEKVMIEAQCQEMLSNKYKSCHSMVNPDLFIGNCVQDMCKYNGLLPALCDNIQHYADACKKQGAELVWRNNTFCPHYCPPKSTYVTCAPACPATCDSIHAASNCQTSACVEGCACDDGFVQSDERCVPISECGCKDTNNHYHPVGEKWLTEHCTQMCVCKKGGEVTCMDSGCGLNEVCSLRRNGQYTCNPTGFSKCTVGGSPYYLAFDGWFHHFAGENEYTLAETTGIPDRLQEFRILGKNAPRNEKQIIIEVYGHTVQLQEKRRLVVDGEMVKPPIQLDDGLQIYQRSYRLHLETDFGLAVSFDKKAHADITLPNNYIKWVRGLCSNFDGTITNNLMQSDGTRNTDANSSGKSSGVVKSRPGSGRPAAADGQRSSWKHPTSDENVETGVGFDLHCSERELRLIDSNSYCGIISDTDGPFSNCHRIISPEQYRLNCIFSLCSVRNFTEVLCFNLEQYALHCQEQGVALGEWRKDSRCEMVCPDNSQYNMQMSSCPASCANLGAPSECESPTVEGCDCLPGFVLSDFHCVPYKSCGCTYRTKYYEVGEKFITEDCSETCECVNTGTVNCTGMRCAPGTTCTIANHARGCF
ncbi:LOW QUALITY PROTEIN: uncharacterized protein LOC116979482 [Amblyraja radiata]|uniref:LOW QUALITY PROTEIN: uncharacterized protein LOC116979482 n=1 Tax=Amblyraja radiata TaxID=386614 RepID=UPI00140391CE|nr:LOW QUALITY PROTEIN: uncharacterized protein LOC116979482 [Amblyraja radiata]